MELVCWLVWFGLVIFYLFVCVFVFPVVYILYPVVGLLDYDLRRVRYPHPNLLKLCYLSTVEIRQIIVHTQAEFQDKCSETLYLFFG
jgi:hypothetical protein